MRQVSSHTGEACFNSHRPTPGRRNSLCRVGRCELAVILATPVVGQMAEASEADGRGSNGRRGAWWANKDWRQGGREGSRDGGLLETLGRRQTRDYTAHCDDAGISSDQTDRQPHRLI